MMVIDMATLQVRSVDDQLYEALGKRAIMENRSISQEVIFILRAYLSSPPLKYQEATARFLEICAVGRIQGMPMRSFQRYGDPGNRSRGPRLCFDVFA